MARRTGRRDRDVCGIPAWWPTAVLGRHAWVMARVQAVPAGFAAHAPRVREGESDRGFERAHRESFENTHDLLGDLLGAKNAGVTNLPHLK
jgi:hypothetical protein